MRQPCSLLCARLSWGPFIFVKVERECMRLMVHRVMCTFQFAVCFCLFMSPCLFLLDPPMVCHTHSPCDKLVFSGTFKVEVEEEYVICSGNRWCSMLHG